MIESKIFKKVIFLAIVMNSLSSSIIHSIKEKEEHFINVYNGKFIITFFYNKNKCKNMDLLNQIVGYLNSNDYIKQNSIVIEKIDYGEIEFFKQHYELEKNIQFELFIRNKRNIFHDFADLFEEGNFEKLKNAVNKFLKERIDKIAIQVNNLNDVLRNLKKNNLIGLYLGEKSNNYENFVILAQKHPDFNFFFNFNKETKKKIFNFFSKDKFLNNDLFIILRDKSLINEFDNKEIIIYDFESSDLNFDFFFGMEKNPKLRVDNHKNNISDIFSKNHMAMVFLISSKTNDEKITIFKDSIKKLPKKFIFTYVSIEKEESLGYIQLFLMNKLNFESDNLYLIYSFNQNLKIEKMKKEFNQTNIINFANSFLLGRGLNYSNKKKEL